MAAQPVDTRICFFSLKFPDSLKSKNAHLVLKFTVQKYSLVIRDMEVAPLTTMIELMVVLSLNWHLAI